MRGAWHRRGGPVAFWLDLALLAAPVVVIVLLAFLEVAHLFGWWGL